MMFKKCLIIGSLALLACTIPTPETAASRKAEQNNGNTNDLDSIVSKATELKQSLKELNKKI